MLKTIGCAVAVRTLVISGLATLSMTVSSNSFAVRNVAEDLNAAPVIGRSAQQNYGKLPISFEPNLGQISPEVKFLARGRGYSLKLGESSAQLSLHAAVGKKEISNAHLRFSLSGSSAQPLMAAEALQEGVSNYLIGKDSTKWHVGVPHYAAVRYREAYPGIDWVLYGNPQQLEYDLLVQPGADPARIRVKIDGAERLVLDKRGNLLIHIAGGTVRQQKPIAYQLLNGRKQLVASTYRLEQGEVKFVLGDYDRKRTLIIDPILVYSTYLGGGGTDIANGIAIDGSGNAYVTGSTTSTDFPAVAGAIQSSTSGNGDIFISKLNAAGDALVYSTYLGGSGTDVANAIAVDRAGNAYVTGSTSSTNFPITSGAFQTTAAGGGDAFVSKLNPAGSALIYSTYMGGSGVDKAYGIVVDGNGNATIAGSTASTNFPTNAPIQAANGGGTDAFVSRLDAAGSVLLYSTYLGGGSADSASAIALDADGNVYVTGTTSSIDFPVTSGAFQSTYAGAGDAFISKLNATGSAFQYSTYLGGSGADASSGIAIDNSGNAYVTGTASTAFPVTANTFQPITAGSTNGFASKLNTSGTALTYSTGLGINMLPGAIALDNSTNAYIVGSATSIIPLSRGLVQTCPGGGSSDAFAIELNTIGSNLIYSTCMGGGNYDSAHAIALDGSANAYIAGETSSNNFPRINAVQPTAGDHGNAGGVVFEAFVSKLNNLTTQVSIAVSPTAINAGQSATLTWTTSNASSCTASNAWSGSQALSNASGLLVSPNASGDSIYTLTCTGNGGTTTSAARLSVTKSAIVLASPVRTANSVALSWSSVSGATLYRIYKSVVFYGSSTSTSSVASGLAVGGVYTFQVRAFNSTGIEIGASNTVQFSMPVSPSAPALAAPVLSGSSVSLSWNTVVGASYYRIYSGTASGNETPYSSTTSTSATVTQVGYGVSYFKVFAFSSDGTASASSNEVSVNRIPGAPILATPQQSGTNVSLNWSPV